MINQEQIIRGNLLAVEKANKWKKPIEYESIFLAKEREEREQSELLDIKWIWPWTVKDLRAAGITNVSELRAASEAELKEIIPNPLSLKGVLNFINNSK